MTSLQSKQKIKISFIIVPLIMNFALCVLIDFLSFSKRVEEILLPLTAKKIYIYLVLIKENMIMNFYLVSWSEGKPTKVFKEFSAMIWYTELFEILFFDIYSLSLKERLWVIEILTS